MYKICNLYFREASASSYNLTNITKYLDNCFDRSHNLRMFAGTLAYNYIILEKTNC